MNRILGIGGRWLLCAALVLVAGWSAAGTAEDVEMSLGPITPLR